MPPRPNFMDIMRRLLEAPGTPRAPSAAEIAPPLSDWARGELPEELHEPLRAIAARRAGAPPDDDAIRAVTDGLAALPAERLSRMESALIEAARLRWTPKVYSRADDLAHLAARPTLKWLFLQHRDGWIRQAALDAIEEPPPGAFFLGAVVWRLNDWVEEVRMAAAAALKRTLAACDPETTAASALALVGRSATWMRWDEGLREAFYSIFDNPKVAAAVARRLIAATAGRGATILVYALRSSTLDSWLPEMARRAVQPAVRALAWRALLAGQARCPDGWERQWIDKAMGVSRIGVRWRLRPLTIATNRLALIDEALGDRSARIRTIAADAVTQSDLGPERLAAWAERMAADRSAAVRERADYVRRRMLPAR